MTGNLIPIADKRNVIAENQILTFHEMVKTGAYLSRCKDSGRLLSGVDGSFFIIQSE